MDALINVDDIIIPENFEIIGKSCHLYKVDNEQENKNINNLILWLNNEQLNIWIDKHDVRSSLSPNEMLDVMRKGFVEKISNVEIDFCDDEEMFVDLMYERYQDLVDKKEDELNLVVHNKEDNNHIDIDEHSEKVVKVEVEKEKIEKKVFISMLNF